MKYPQLVSMPSAVSDWLEEQLEARGIDAVVYTRYVLSLLYRDPVDIICPDQDLHFTNPTKEVRRSGGGRKRFCRSTDYWGHAHADADQLKRSAAVECLKSASDQKCGIESLVDELCEKLKEAKSDSTSNSEPAHFTKPVEAQSQDPAKRYYAAFPALSRNSSAAAATTAATSPSIITLIPKWFGSPKKKSGARCKQTRSSSYEDKLHFKVEAESMKARPSGKQRYNYLGRNKKDLGYCRNMTKSTSGERAGSEWDFYNNNNNARNTMMESNSYEHEESMYDDLPVDIRDLLDSPTPPGGSKMMNLANMRDTGSKNNFIQCGTNIISSIWSNDAPMEDYDNTYNQTVDRNQLDYKFSNISIWSSDNINIIKENETNSFFESCNASKSSFVNYGFESEAPWSFEKWSDSDTYEIDPEVSKSLLKLNHNKEESSFMEVIPRGARFKLPIGTPKGKKVELEGDKDDLLNSASSHFKPINEKVEKAAGQYADGTTFVIPSSLEKINYKRSESGREMYLEADYGKYLEYKKVNEDLTLKFKVNQNDKACQTDVDDVDFVDAGCKSDDLYFPGDLELLDDDVEVENEACHCGVDKFEDCPVHPPRADSVMAEIFGKFEVKCDKCSGVWGKDWSGGSAKNIWSGGEVCMACLGLNAKPLPSQDLLREDITQDGEQLLSDLSSMQKSYMEELPVAEMSCDINQLIASKEWRAEGTTVPIHSGSFSFATRLEQDFLFNMATIPTLRSVTL